MNIKETIAAILAGRQNKIDFDELLKETKAPAAGLRDALAEMEMQGKVVVSKKGKIFAPGRFGYFTGRLEVKRLGFAFLVCDDKTQDDIYIGADNKTGALNDDIVLVRLLSKEETHRRREGVVVKILSSEELTVVGLLTDSFVIPDDERMDDVHIQKKNLGGAKSGQKVIAKIVKRAGKNECPEGEITQILGEAGVSSVEMLSYIKRFNLPEEFPDDVMAQAKEASERELNIKGRLDLRDQTVFTIDGESAKDLDDAVSIKKLEDGYELGVHIADVAHYVLEGSKLDKEALDRGTSVYLADYVIPMLPEPLSNGACSLSEGTEKLTLSCIMKITSDGKIQSGSLHESVIRSVHRMTYTDVNAILEGNDKNLLKKYADIIDDINVMERLAEQLRLRREEKGSIDFELDETQFVYDSEGRVTDVMPRVRGNAERLIEEFMLAANRTVAEEYFWRQIPFVYRVHEKPDEEKMKTFELLYKNLGYTIKGKLENVHPKMLQKVLSDIKGTQHENIISQIMLRSLKKAEYSEQCIGHFGLSFPYYCHFTSPIRRYPDLAVHRIIKHDLGGRLTDKYIEKLEERVVDISDKSSLRERAAMQAERKVDDMKKAEYMMGKEGMIYPGVVSGVTKNALFVELDNTVEGVIPLSSLLDDYYIFDENFYFVKGEHSGKKISLGDEMTIRVMAVSVYPPRVEFERA